MSQSIGRSTSICTSHRLASRIVVFTAMAVLMTFTSPASELAVLWNKLGSDDEILHSAWGPNLSFFTNGWGLEVPANHTYAPGVFGNAVTIDAGPYYVCARVHNVVLDNVPAYISTEHGAIETWYKQITDPVAYSHNPYRIFDGSFGLGAGTVFESQGDGLPTGRLRFGLQFGAPAVAEVYADDGIVGYNISAYNGTWIHVAGVWDRAGIDGSSDTLRLYVNGDLVARSTHADWGSVVGNQADICGGNDDLIAQQFYMDNLKVWDYALTDFSHRWEEGWVPEPASLALICVAFVFGRRR